MNNLVRNTIFGNDITNYLKEIQEHSFFFLMTYKLNILLNLYKIQLIFSELFILLQLLIIINLIKIL